MVIFDLDGTLLDLAVDWAHVRAWLRDDFGATGDGVFAPLGALPEPHRARATQRLAQEELKGADRGTVRPGAQAALQAAAEHGPVGIVTRNSRLAAETFLAHVDNNSRNRIVVGREDVVRVKPDPEGLHSLLKQAGCKGYSNVFVGDSRHDVDAGHAAGITVIVVWHPDLPTPGGGDYYLSSLEQLPDLLQDLAADGRTTGGLIRTKGGS